MLGRGGAAFWAPFERTDDKREYLMGWLPANVIDWELIHPEWPAPMTDAEADRMVDPAEIDATASWLVGAKKLAATNGVKFLLAIAPMASVDPDYAAYWKPWPRFYSQNRRREASRLALLAELDKRGLHPIDLTQDLQGVPGTYRVTDGHWTDLGTSIVAERVAADLARMRGGVAPTPRPLGQ